MSAGDSVLSRRSVSVIEVERPAGRTGELMLQIFTLCGFCLRGAAKLQYSEGWEVINSRDT